MMSFPSAYGGAGLGGGVHNPRMSTFSLATTANPFASNPPSDSTDPSDEEVLSELRHYLSSQVSLPFLSSAIEKEREEGRSDDDERTKTRLTFPVPSFPLFSNDEQDLMTVTKKTARVALFARFPKADLTGRVPWINQSIDGILQGSM